MLKDSVEFSNFILPVCLNSRPVEVDDDVVVIGWGNTGAGLQQAKSATGKDILFTT